MSDKLKTIHFENFKLDVTEEQFDNMKNYMGINEEDGKYVCYSPSYEGFDCEESILYLRRGGIWNQNKFFESGSGGFYEFEGSSNIIQLEKFNFYRGYRGGHGESLFLLDYKTNKFLEFNDIFDDIDDFDGFDVFDENYQTDRHEFYLENDFDIISYLKSVGNILD